MSSDQMDSRCPRKLKNFPSTWCPLAVMRLRARRTASHELSEAEEERCGGCPWAINHQLSNYCFFKYMNDFGRDKIHSEMEVAALDCLSVETVRKTEKIAIAKLKNTKDLKMLKEAVGSDSVVEEHITNDDYKIYR